MDEHGSAVCTHAFNHTASHASSYSTCFNADTACCAPNQALYERVILYFAWDQARHGCSSVQMVKTHCSLELSLYGGAASGG